MGKNSFRKPRPSPPHWHWWNVDGCYFCHNRKACNGCKTLKDHQKHRDARNDMSYKEQTDTTMEM